MYESISICIKYIFSNNMNSWGDEGYVKMKRNVGSGGICGIAMAASYPIKTSPNPAPGNKQ